MTKLRYRGRFAPSPTGNLHIGSLIAAVASYLTAKSQQGEWWVRIEDIDPPREVTGATVSILKTLEAHGLEWDQLSFQHERLDIYQNAMDTLRANKLIYPCSCSRKSLSDSYGNQPVYPGICRNRSEAGPDPVAWRIHCPDQMMTLEDGIQGSVPFRLAEEIGDFIVKRADGLYSYQLAVAVDDAEQGMTEVVRGADLLDSTPRQIVIQQALNLATPRYQHLPVIVNPLGQKLSKQSQAAPLDNTRPVASLWTTLNILGQTPPAELQQDTLVNIWDWAKNNWDSDQIPRCSHITLDETRDLADKSSNDQSQAD